MIVLFLGIFFTSLYILVFQGFGFPAISPFWNAALRMIAAGSIQSFFLGTKWPKLLQCLPLFVSGCLAFWACWMYLTAWSNTGFLTLMFEFLSPALTCSGVFMFHCLKRRNYHEKA